MLVCVLALDERKELIILDRPFSILLVEDDPIDCQSIVQYIDTLEDVRLVGVTNNSDKALESTKDYQPDAIILDLELHKGTGNGISFLMMLAKESLSYLPYILVTTNNISPITHAQVRQLGADFVMVKSQADYSPESAVDFLLSLRGVIHGTRKHNAASGSSSDEAPAEAKRRLLTQISTEIDLVGISPKAIGRSYLIDAIALLISGNKNGYITTIAQKYGKTNASVERAMQNAINSAWRSADIEDLQTYYTARIKSEKGYPTLTEFIFYYANKIKGAVRD